MTKLSSLKRNILIALALVLFGVIFRLSEVAPNFAPVGAIAIFSGFLFSKSTSNKSSTTNRALFTSVPIILMVVSDYFIGYHSLVLWVYGSYFLISLVPIIFSKSQSNSKFLAYPFMSSILFYLVTNFGVWATTTMYSKDIYGLIQSYLMAVPFLKNTLQSDLLFTGIFLVFTLFQCIW